MTGKRKPGRPAGRTYERRSGLSLRPGTHDLLQRRIEREGVTLQSWVRWLIRKALGLPEEEG